MFSKESRGKSKATSINQHSLDVLYGYFSEGYLTPEITYDQVDTGWNQKLVGPQ